MIWWFIVPAELRVRVQHDGDRRVLLPRRMVAALDASGRTSENNLRHAFDLDRELLAAPGAARRSYA